MREHRSSSAMPSPTPNPLAMESPRTSTRKASSARAAAGPAAAASSRAARMTARADANATSVAAGQRVDRDGDREDEGGVLAGPHVDAVGLADAEPLLRDGRDRVAAALDLVLVVDDVPVRLQVVAVLDVDREAVADPHERLVDGRGGVAAALDRDLVPEAQLALLDPGDLGSGGVLEHEGLAEAERLAVDLVRPVALLVLDPEVVADGQELLPHEEPLARLLVAMS